MNSKILLSTVLFTLIVINGWGQHLDESLSFEKIKENIKTLETKRDTLKLIDAYSSIANKYYTQYRDNEAIPYFIKAYKLSNLTDDYEKRMITSLNMSVVEENRKDYIKAIIYRKEYDKSKDSLQLYKIGLANLEFSAKLENEKLKSESRFNAHKNTMHLYLTGLIIIVVLLSITCIIFLKRKA